MKTKVKAALIHKSSVVIGRQAYIHYTFMTAAIPPFLIVGHRRVGGGKTGANGCSN